MFRLSKYEPWLYFLAFMLALALRLVGLGVLPLNDSEASLALQSLGIAQGTRPLLASPVSYLSLTGLLFAVFGSSDFLARLIPALTGSMLALVPLLFRRQLKPRPALVLAFGLALDPGLVFISRQADGMVLAVVFAFCAWAQWRDKRLQWAGVFGALALLSGPFLWMGLLSLGLAWFLQRALEMPARQNGQTPDETESTPAPARTVRTQIGPALLYGAATILAVGTLFFLSPNGLSAWLRSIPAFLRGWAQPSGVPVGRMLLALVVYEPLPLIVGLIALVRGWAQSGQREMRLSLWFALALLLVLIYPGRQVTDLVWVILPLWALSALEISRQFHAPYWERTEIFGASILVFLVLVFEWLTLGKLANDTFTPEGMTQVVVMMAGGLLLLAACIILLSLGWSSRTAIMGAFWGTVLAFTAYTLGAAWGTSGLRTPGGVELWASGPRMAQARLLVSSVADLSDWSVGDVHSQPVTLVDLDWPSLQWQLRQSPLESVDTLDLTSTPPLVVTPNAVTDLHLSAAYRGQDFTWRQTPSWVVMQPTDWLRWLILRQMPQDPESVILWARTDIMPGEARTFPTP
jgi:hypothetical protein